LIWIGNNFCLVLILSAWTTAGAFQLQKDFIFLKEMPYSVRIKGQIRMTSTRLANEGQEMIPTRRSLLDRLKHWDDHESWRSFFETYWMLIYNTARAAGLTDPEAQDVVQETVIGVFKRMPEFQYKESGSFKSWLLQLTTWRIKDQLRRRNRDNALGKRLVEDAVGNAAVENVADPDGVALEKAWEEEWESTLMEAAVQRAKKKVDSKQFQLFDLYVVKKWPMSRITKTMGVNPGNVYLAKHRVGKLIQREAKLLREKPV
jgi:RNA polymerase sigma factor (sigma-70 family)